MTELDPAARQAHEPVLAQWREQVSTARRERRALNIVGGGTRRAVAARMQPATAAGASANATTGTTASTGQTEGFKPRGARMSDGEGASAGEVLDARRYAGIVEYEPTELVVTVRCGTPVADLEEALAARGQFLPFEPPRFGQRGAGQGGTIGGAVATGLSGPRRAYAGSMSDYVLGAVLLDAKADVLKFGGQVMKNVAGYDVSRLLCGSHGILGVIAEVSLKVLPRPVRELTLAFERTQEQALTDMRGWASQPLPISATWWHDGQLRVRLSGAGAAIEAATARLGGESMAADEAADFWDAVRDQRHDAFQSAGAGTCWRLSVPATTPVLDLPGRQIVEWGGALRWWMPDADAGTAAARVTAEAAASIRDRARSVRGTAALWHGQPDEGVEPMHPVDPSVLALHRRLKQAFDPDGIFNRDRMFKGL